MAPRSAWALMWREFTAYRKLAQRPSGPTITRCASPSCCDGPASSRATPALSLGKWGGAAVNGNGVEPVRAVAYVLGRQEPSAYLLASREGIRTFADREAAARFAASRGVVIVERPRGSRNGESFSDRLETARQDRSGEAIGTRADP